MSKCNHDYREFCCGKPVRVKHCEHRGYSHRFMGEPSPAICGIKKDLDLITWECHMGRNHLLINCILIQQEMASARAERIGNHEETGEDQ